MRRFLVPLLLAGVIVVLNVVGMVSLYLAFAS